MFVVVVCCCCCLLSFVCWLSVSSCFCLKFVINIHKKSNRLNFCIDPIAIFLTFVCSALAFLAHFCDIEQNRRSISCRARSEKKQFCFGASSNECELVAIHNQIR